MSSAHVTYSQRSDITPDGEVAALAAVYQCIIDCHAKKRPTPEIPRRARSGQPSQSREASTSSAADRVPFDQLADFQVLTDRALAWASLPEPYGYLLRQLADCYPAEDGPLYDQQHRGATYETLAAIGHQVGMSKAERIAWYRTAESVPLSQRHAGHILSRLKRQAA